MVAGPGLVDVASRVHHFRTAAAHVLDDRRGVMDEQPVVVKRFLDVVPVRFTIDEPAKVRQFVDELRLNYPALIGGYGAMELSRTFGNKLMALPFTLVIDRSGNIIHTQLGPLSRSKLRALVDKAL